MEQLRARSFFLSFSALASTRAAPAAAQVLICRSMANVQPIFEGEFLLIFNGKARRVVCLGLLYLSKMAFSLAWTFGRSMAKKRHETYLPLNYSLLLVDDERFNNSVTRRLPMASDYFRR